MSRAQEFADQKALLGTPIGACGSGALRYGAAMYFYRENLMPPQVLEIYRRCSKFDREDPLEWAAYEGLDLPDLSPPKADP